MDALSRIGNNNAHAIKCEHLSRERVSYIPWRTDKLFTLFICLVIDSYAQNKLSINGKHQSC